MKLIYQLLLLGCVCSSLFACSNSDEPTPNPSAQEGSLIVEFDNIVGNKNLVLSAAEYKNDSGEDFTVTRFDYFVSNFKLLKADGTVYTVPQDSSYFLVQESVKESQFVKLKNVPVGDYTGIEFVIGVDSVRNTLPLSERTGVLDPGATDMYWAWNSGYIFLKLEGTSSLGNPANNKFYYHVGLYGGYSQENATVNNVHTVKLNFNNDRAKVTDKSTPQIHLFADIQKIFDGKDQTFKIADANAVMGANQLISQIIANNYRHMFSYDHVH